MNKQTQNLPCIEIEPSLPAKRAVIWLHGLGADGNDFAPIVPELKLPEEMAIRFIFPHAPVMPVTINHGYQMRAWYDIVSLEIDNHMDETGMLHSQHSINQLIAHENSRGIPSKNIIIGGFSQGAVIAYLTALSHSETLGGLLALSGYLPFAEKLTQEATEQTKNMPIFIGHGNIDPVVPYFLSEQAYTLLKGQGFNVEMRSYPVPHTVSPEELTDIRNWIQNSF